MSTPKVRGKKKRRGGWEVKITTITKVIMSENAELEQTDQGKEAASYYKQSRLSNPRRDKINRLLTLATTRKTKLQERA